ncbi:hypothetical protein V6N12_032979 [Hibiscus sabdariffa]|uniref:Uncharacterized protein n=1 Tax=Hibiscus sabdariffa TaxID=183260 RepID=A0ABR2AKS6_9ROSI
MGFVVASSSETGGVQSSPWLIEDGGAPSGAGITCGVIFGRLSLGNRPGKNFVDSVATNSAPVSSQKGMLNLQTISGQKVNFQLAFFGVCLGPAEPGQNYGVDMAQLGEDVPLEKSEALKR